MRLFKKKKVTSSSLKIENYNVRVKRRSFQRSLNLSLKPDGELLVTSGLGVPDSVIKKFVLSQANWVEENLLKFNELRIKYPKKKIKAGESLPFLGREYPVRFEFGKNKRTKIQIKDYNLFFLLQKPLNVDNFLQNEHDELKGDIIRFYQASGKEIIQGRVEIWSQKMQLFPSKVSYRSQKTRWGSCNSLGNISLNWRLVCAPIEVIDYVVIHELAHLKYQDHSKRFWTLVAEHCPDYKKHKKWLRENQYNFDFLATKSEIHPNTNLKESLWV